MLHDLDVARTSASERSGCVVYRLPDLEFVVTHAPTAPTSSRYHEAVPQVRFIWKATMVLEGRTRYRSAFSERPPQRGNKLEAVDVLLL